MKRLIIAAMLIASAPASASFTMYKCANDVELKTTDEIQRCIDLEKAALEQIKSISTALDKSGTDYEKLWWNRCVRLFQMNLKRSNASRLFLECWSWRDMNWKDKTDE